MNDLLDTRIAELEKELVSLRRQKLTELQSQVAALQASLTDAPEAPARRGRPPGPASATRSTTPQPRKGRPPGSASGRGKSTKGWATELASNPQAFSAKPRKSRGRPRGKRVTDEEALAKITKIVAAAGKDGTSARKVSIASDLFYPRVIALMADKFKKSGEGRWTRYSVK